MSRQELAEAIVDQLGAANADTPLPRRIVIHGDDSGALAQAVSRENHRRVRANQAAAAGGAAGAPLAAVPAIDVIGSRGTAATLESGASWAGALTSVADRFLQLGIDPPAWLVYRDGVLVEMPGRHRHTDLATLIAALESPTPLPLLTRLGIGS